MTCLMPYLCSIVGLLLLILWGIPNSGIRASLRGKLFYLFPNNQKGIEATDVILHLKGR